MTRCLHVRRFFTSLRKYILCMCFHKTTSSDDIRVNAERNNGDQDIIRLPVAANVQSHLVRPNMMTLERWPSAPTFINIPPTRQFQPPVSPLTDRPRKRLSSPGRLDSSIIDQIRGELQDTEGELEKLKQYEANDKIFEDVK